MRATTIHAARDIRLTDVDDAVHRQPHRRRSSRWRPAASAAPTCGPTAARTRSTPGRPIGHECVGVVEEVGVGGRRRSRRATSSSCRSATATTPAPHCRAGVTSACENQGFTVERPGGVLPGQPGRGHACSRPTAAGDDEACSRRCSRSPTCCPPAGTRPCPPAYAGRQRGRRRRRRRRPVRRPRRARCMGAEKVVAMSRHEPRQEIAKAFGATHVVAERGKEGEAAILEITEGVGADAVLECVGTDQSMQTAFAVARPGSPVGFVGVPHGVELPVRRMFQKNVGLFGGVAPVRAYLAELLHQGARRLDRPGPGLRLERPARRGRRRLRATWTSGARSRSCSARDTGPCRDPRHRLGARDRRRQRLPGAVPGPPRVAAGLVRGADPGAAG